ncbi:unnamed protein product, partial [Mesorhabditis belari]|uniref:Uncharacterized protein n=1 Tax=Mesorhabditis belari TaxID=2138241 RepID=A0AAF3F0K1_9BILA
MRVLLCLATFALSYTLACEDGVDNILRIHDSLKGKGRIAFENVELLTYDGHKNPACDEGKGVWNFPGFFRLKSGKVKVTKAVKESEGELKLALSLEKNSWIIGTVCENGKSKNQFVPAEICDFPLCKFAQDKCKMIEQAGEFDLTELTSTMGPDNNGLIDMGPLPIPQIDGEWALSVKLMQGARKLAGLQVQEDDQWFKVAADSLNIADVVKKTSKPQPAPPGAQVHDEF